MEAAEQMQQLMRQIAEALVDDVSAVDVQVEKDEASGAQVIYILCAQSDVGKLIGKQGRTARSLRTILSAASMKYQQRFALDIEEGEEINGDDTGE